MPRFYTNRETSGMTEQNRADVNRLSQICIQIPDNPENRSSNVKNVPRAAATAIIVNECRCEEFEAQIAWSRILALAAGTRRAETSETSARAEGCQSGDAKQRNAQTGGPNG